MRWNTKKMLEVMSRGGNGEMKNTEEKMETMRDDENGERKHRRKYGNDEE